MPAHNKQKRPDAPADEQQDSKPVYLVVEHKFGVPSHSIVITSTKAPTTTIPLRLAERGMSFAAVGSRWIVGVSGDYRLHSTVLDLATSKESGGPSLRGSKVNPILIPHRNMLYLLSSRPKIDRGPDFLPWFEVFTFGDGAGGGDATRELPPPPVFPFCINPIEYADPPDVRVTAHAVVGSHILLSVSYTVSDSVRQQLRRQAPPEDLEEEKGTCAFNVDRREWQMVHPKNLPFLGEAVPLDDDGHLFVATRSEDGAAAVYHIEILSCELTNKTELCIMELPVVGRRIKLDQLIRASGDGRFCTFDVRGIGGAIVHRTYGVRVVGANGDANAPASVAVKRCRRRIHELACPTPVVSALTF